MGDSAAPSAGGGQASWQARCSCFYGWWLLLLLVFVQCAGHSGSIILNSLTIAYMFDEFAAIGISNADFSVFWLIGTGCAGIGTLFYGRLIGPRCFAQSDVFHTKNRGFCTNCDEICTQYEKITTGRGSACLPRCACWGAACALWPAWARTCRLRCCRWRFLACGPPAWA